MKNLLNIPEKPDPTATHLVGKTLASDKITAITAEAEKFRETKLFNDKDNDLMLVTRYCAKLLVYISLVEYHEEMLRGNPNLKGAEAILKKARLFGDLFENTMVGF